MRPQMTVPAAFFSRALAGIILLIGFATPAAILDGATTNGATAARSPGLAPQGATITFRRIFKSSVPEFIEIKVEKDGAGSYDIRQLSEDADPQPLQIGAAVREKIFDLAAQLHNFAGLDLDVHRRIADLGEKTFRYENDGAVQETHFNYTINHEASQLLMIFEGLARQQQDQTAIEQKLRYDRLGVNDALVQFEADLSQRTLPEPERLLPVLDRVAADTKLVDVARQRARALAERIRASQP
jgi:hypothetical protein